MADQRRLTAALVVGAVLMSYVLCYGACRAGHVLIHRVSWIDDESANTVEQGMKDGFPYRDWVTARRIPFIIFTPLRWFESKLWDWRDDHGGVRPLM